MLKTSERGAVPPFVVMDVMEAAAAYQREHGAVLHLEVGQPSTGAPRTAIEAAQRALASDPLGYTVAVGLPALRERIARHYMESQQLKVDPARVIVTPGSSGAFVLAFLAAFEAGDRVALAMPGYPCYKNILSSLGIEVVPIHCGPETRYQLTADALRECKVPLDGVIIASPSNPTGTVIVEEELRAIVDYCDERGVRLVSDEIYHGVEFGEKAVSAAKFSDDCVVVNSFSKYFSMTGWRVGWMIAPTAMVRNIEKLAQNLFIAASSLSQWAAIGAFEATEELQGHIERYRKNRNIILDALPQAGITKIAPPDGAFYIYADAAHLTQNSVAFCKQLLEATGVAITPGVDFDPYRGSRTIRFSYAADTPSIAEAMNRCLDFFNRVPQDSCSTKVFIPG